MKPNDIASYLFLALTWGLSFLVLVRVAHAFGWVGAVSFRCFVAGATLVGASLVLRRRLDFGFGLVPLLVVGATTVAGQLVGLTFATPKIGTAMAAILVATIPLFAMVIASLAGVERMTPRGLVGVVLGFAGIVLLVGFPAVPVTGEFVLGAVCTLLASLSAAIGSVYASRRLKQAGAWEVTAGAFLVGGLISLPLVAVVPPPALPGPLDYLFLLILGGLMSATTYVVYFRMLASIGPTKAVSVEFAVTIVAVLVGALILHEPLSLAQIAGAVVIVLGCALVLGLIPFGPPRRLAPTKAGP